MRIRALFICACVAITGCAASVIADPAQFVALGAGQAPREITVHAEMPIRLSTGYARMLPAGSRWRETGSIKQGVVYMPVGTVFTIEGRDVHEAYLVVRDGRLEGFYLVAEGRFSPLQPSLSIPVTGGKQ